MNIEDAPAVKRFSELETVDLSGNPGLIELLGQAWSLLYKLTKLDLSNTGVRTLPYSLCTLRQFVATVTSEGLDKGENVTVRTRHAPTGVLTLDAPAM